MITKAQVIILLSIALTLFTLELQSQNPIKEKVSFNDFSIVEQNAMNKRWAKYQPYINLATLNGDNISGQLIRINSYEAVIYPGKEIVHSAEQAEKFIYIPIDEIERVISIKIEAKTEVTRGMIIGYGIGAGGLLTLSGGWMFISSFIIAGPIGSGIGAAIGSSGYKKKISDVLYLDQGSSEYSSDMLKLYKSAILTDSIKYPIGINELLTSSDLMGAVFPDKKIRISFAKSFGPNTIGKKLVETLQPTQVHIPSESPKGPRSFEFFDLAFRHKEHFIIGFQFNSYLSNHGLAFYGYSTSSSYFHYNFDIEKYNEGGIYLDYALKPMSRFFTKPYELLFGAGALIGFPSVALNYSYVPDVYTYAGSQSISNSSSGCIQGLQLRSSFHFFTSPDFSIFAGIEGNFYTRFTMEEISGLPTFDPDEDINIPEHELNFNSLKFKIGTSIYF